MCMIYLVGERNVLITFYSSRVTGRKNNVRDIIKNLIIYNESRLTELQKNFGELFENEEAVLDTILMNRIQIQDWGKRPLGKLTHDIYKEFMERKD